MLLIAAPWWMELVNALAAKHLSVKLPSSGAQVAWGFALVLVGLIYHVVVHYITELVQERQSASKGLMEIEHDKAILKGFFGVVSESELEGILDFIASQHAYRDSQGTRLYRAADYLNSPSMEFLNPDLQVHAAALAKSIRELTQFMGLHFFEYNSPLNGDLRFCMHPDLNVDRARGVPSIDDQVRYDDFSNQLEEAVQVVEQKYREFRRMAKQRLAV